MNKDFPFVVGAHYRRSGLHDTYGGQRYGGISTPIAHDFVMLFTGDAGQQYGYHDRFQADGSFWYTGEGQVGNQLMKGGNLAIQSHETVGKKLALFRIIAKGWVQFEGFGDCIGYHTERRTDRNGDLRDVLVFELSMGSYRTGVAPSLRRSLEPSRLRAWRRSLKSLRDLAVASEKSQDARTARVTVRDRSEAVRVYVLRRADGCCEGCGTEAPFKARDGRPYLEPHHIRRLADGGPDHPRWVVALCPNCHCRVHYGEDGEDFNRSLAETVDTLESDWLSRST